MVQPDRRGPAELVHCGLAVSVFGCLLGLTALAAAAGSNAPAKGYHSDAIRIR